MEHVRPKKSLGQHFLKDRNIAFKIVGKIDEETNGKVLEIGPGTGILTGILLEKFKEKLLLVEVDRESVAYLKTKYPEMVDRIIETDILDFDFPAYFDEPVVVVGNLPYNITSQIFFRIIENRDLVSKMICMIQKEVADRLVSPPGNKTYGILSVFLQAF